jgi:hypothetical protein
MRRPIDFYDHSHEEETPSEPPRAIRGVIFAFFFEAIAALTILFGRAIIHFFTH